MNGGLGYGSALYIYTQHHYNDRLLYLHLLLQDDLIFLVYISSLDMLELFHYSQQHHYH